MKPENQVRPAKHCQGSIETKDMGDQEQMERSHERDEALECVGVTCDEWKWRYNTTRIMKKHVHITPVENGEMMPCWTKYREDSRCREECSHDDTEMTQGQEA